MEDQDAAQATESDSMALLVGKDSPLCSGSLVAGRVVLTAASCVTGSDKGRPEVVLVGAVNAYLDPFRWVLCCAVRPAGIGACENVAAGQVVCSHFSRGTCHTSRHPCPACSGLQAARGV